ncbi:MAG: hypothetical protein AB8H80_00930 [Planctomycetota bacterium]
MLRWKETLASLALLTTAIACQQTAVVRSLQPFLPPTIQAVGQPVSAVNYSDDLQIARSGAMRKRNADLTWLEELLQARHRPAIRAGSLQLVFDMPNRVTISGAEPLVQACATDLDAITAALSRTVQVTVYQLPLADGKLPNTHLDGAELRQLVDGARPLWTTHARTRSGGSVELRRCNWPSYARDLEPEIAEKSAIDAPKFDRLFVGTSCSATVHSLPGERLLLHGSWLASRLVEMREQLTGNGGPSIDLPHVQILAASFSGLIDSGGALVVAARSGQRKEAGVQLLVSARYSSPAASMPQGIGAIPITAWQAAYTAHGTPGPARFPGEDAFAPESESALLAPADVCSLLGAFGKCKTPTGFLIGTADGQEIQAAEATIEQLCRANGQGFSVHVTRDGTAGIGGIQIIQPTLAGLACHAFVGSERAHIAGFDAELASGANAYNPTVDIARSGVWSWCTLAAPASGGGHFVDGLWRSAEPATARMRSLTTKPPLLVECTDYKASAWPWSGSITANRPHELSPGMRIQIRERQPR